MPRNRSKTSLTTAKASGQNKSATASTGLSARTNSRKSATVTVLCGGLAVLVALYAGDILSYFGSKPGTRTVGQASRTGGSVLNGGWRIADTDTEKLFNTSVCNIDRRSVTELSSEEFEKVYRYKKPLIVVFPNGAQDWTDPLRWTVSSLTEEYGHWSVMMGNSRDIVRDGGTGNEETSFQEFVDKLIAEKNVAGEPYYVFDRNFCNDSSLPSTLTPPPYLKVKDGVDDSIFFLGSSRSGVAFHKHADAWNGVVFGRKRWFLYPLETTPPGGVYPGFTQLEWYRTVYPKLSQEERPLECIQEPGEIIYLPEGIYHGTINLGDTIAVGIQKKQAKTKVQKLFYEENIISKTIAQGGSDTKMQKLRKKKKEIFESLLHLLPDNAEVQLKAGKMYQQDGMIEEAIHYTKRAVQMDRYFIVAILNLASLYAQHGSVEEADQLYRQAMSLSPRLWDVYAFYGDFLVQHDRPQEAIHVYLKGLELEPDSRVFWLHLKVAQERSGDSKGAAKSQAQIDRLEAG